MDANCPITIRRARREDVGAIVRMLADDALGASRGLIEDVRVASDRRSGGIGEQLVQCALAEARASGCKLVELLTHHSRVDAQRFYERLGFARSHVGMTIRF